MVGLEYTFTLWIDHFRHLYRYHKAAFMWSVLILFLLFLFWTLYGRSRLHNRKYIQILGYCIIFIFTLTNLFRLPALSFEYNLLPLWSYSEILIRKNLFLLYENLANILVYIPVGYFALKAFPKNKRLALLIVVGTSAVMEVIQFSLRLGLFEWDDCIHNIIGGLVGIKIAYSRKTLSKEDDMNEEMD